MYRKKRAFTLIELLVVIAIIAILAAILFPVFAQAKAAAKITTSLSNQKQICLGLLMYSSDVDDMRVLRRSQPAGDQVSWKQLAAPYIKNTDMFRDSVNPASAYKDLESDPAMRAFLGWSVPLAKNLTFTRGYAIANIFSGGSFADDKAVSLTSFAEVAKMFNVVESKEVWEDMGPYLGWTENVDDETSWFGAAAPQTGLKWNWGGEKWDNKAMVASYQDGHAKRIAFSAACGDSFMKKPVGSSNPDSWGLTAGEQAGYSWADTWCTTLPAKFK